jgi:translation initiation factor 2D
MRGGADLMTPGLARGPPFPPKATKGSVVAVAGLERPSVPVVVGTCEIDVSGLQSVQGVKGHAVRGLHWCGDEIWSWSSSGQKGREPPEALEGWDDIDDLTAQIGKLNPATPGGGGGEDEEGTSHPAAEGGTRDDTTPVVEGEDPPPAGEEAAEEQRELSTRGTMSVYAISADR